MELDLPPDLEMKIANLIEDGEFESQEDAVRQLVRTGLTAYQTQPDTDDEEPFDEPLDESPTYHDDDEYVF